MVNYNKILTLSLAAASIVMSAACLSACSDEDITQATVGKEHTITLNITPVDNEDTRSAVTSTTASAENTIHRLAIAIVNPKNSNIIGGVREIEVSSQESTGTVSYSFTDAEISEGDKVIIFANCPQGKFSKAKNYNDIKYGNYDLTADEALNQDGGATASYSNLPMYGEATATFNGTNNLSADVFIYHMVTKVTLNSLTVDLRSGDTFTPEEMFMSNVIDGATLNPIDNYTYSTKTSILNGESGTGSSSRSYLTTGKISWTGTTDASTGAIKYTSNLPRFYVTPNTRTADGGAGATMLVIKGTYKDGGKYNSRTVYYSMFVNYNNDIETDASADGHTAKTLFPNANYVMDVTIKGVGMEEDYDYATSVNAVSLKSQFRGFSATTTPVVIGEYLFNDGSWGPYGYHSRNLINSSHYPVAIIFSNTTSKIDQGHGWTHGYAVAINKCGGAMAWASSTANYATKQVTPSSKTNYTSPVGATDKTTWMNDLDGYTETQSIASVTDYANVSNPKNYYPAVWYALNDGTNKVGITEDITTIITETSIENKWVESSDLRTTMGLQMATSANTSGWYLGSVGQYYLMFKNFSNLLSSSAGKFTDDDVIRDEGSSSRWKIEDKMGSVIAYTCLNSLGLNATFYCASVNDFFGNRLANGSGYPMPNIYGDRPVIYWTSSEYSDEAVYQIRLIPSSYSYGESAYKEDVGDIVIVATKKSASTQERDCVGIRPVIAF